MAVYYDSIKSMKVAKIGSILPWGGDGGTGFLASNIPQGWIVCDGTTLTASDYPLLASVIGDTYGGDMTKPNGDHYTFPYVDPIDGSDTATFRLPNLSNRLPLDLEPYHLDDVTNYYGQVDPKNQVLDNNGLKLGDLVSGYGETYDIRTSWSANADIDFSLNLSGNLYFKYTGFVLTDPDFLESVYTLNRKLGINHTPSHSHTDSIPSAIASQNGPMVFQTDSGVEMTGTTSFTNTCSGSYGPYICQFKSTEPHSWRNGSVNLSYYGDATYEFTLPRTASHFEFVTDTVNAGKNYWDQVPAGANNWRGSTRGAGPKTESYKQTIPAQGNSASVVDIDPVSSHAQPAFKGMFPRPMEDRNRANFYGFTPKGGTVPSRGDGLKDSPEQRPTKVVPNCVITEGSNKITLPDNTNISQQYTVGTDSWLQWDLVRPLMYVTPSDNNDKYKYIAEGTYVQSIQWVPDGSNSAAGGNYEVTLNQNAGSGDTSVPAGWGTATIGLEFKDGTYPTTLNTTSVTKDPLESSFRSHNHGSFEIAQQLGTMVGPPSHTASDADGSSLAAESIDNALNIAVDTTQPSLTMTFIIKAY